MNPNEGFYRPKPPVDQSRLQELKNYKKHARRKADKGESIGNIYSFFGRNPCAEFFTGFCLDSQISMETKAMLLALDCEPYKLTPTKEESEILELEYLFDKPNNDKRRSNKKVSKITKDNDVGSGGK